ncbi:PilZ domain-containing protein [Thermodesulfobacterium hydrogeniphilum]|uniref:PilZ domain-containing protein n=1 Tax=Thermodesulfobacterium hydrogeniphilum TaxID=161156 RepID=UPI000570A75A|nr:PilZ domain-containing protein [Thermodesulfobacterium hydrogeniphilum]
MDKDKRYHSRYKTKIETKAAHEKGFIFPVEILNISMEGAKLKTERSTPLKEKEKLELLIKWKALIKVKAEIKWINLNKNFVEFGVSFLDTDFHNREALSFLISEMALSSFGKTDVP